jgi:hypothetical protein
MGQMWSGLHHQDCTPSLLQLQGQAIGSLLQHGAQNQSIAMWRFLTLAQRHFSSYQKLLTQLCTITTLLFLQIQVELGTIDVEETVLMQ